MFGLLFRGVFLVGIISWYSAGVWKFVDDYFRDEYKEYLGKEFKRNKHLRMSSEFPEYSTVAKDTKVLSPDDVKPFINAQEGKTCERNLFHPQEELDYHNQQKTIENDRQESQDDDGFISYWHKRRNTDNSYYNLYCDSKEATCEDNWQWSDFFTMNSNPSTDNDM